MRLELLTDRENSTTVTSRHDHHLLWGAEEEWRLDQ